MSEQTASHLDPRLQRIAAQVRPGAVFADIGCDHGLLSIELVRQGAQKGYACDIKPGPLQAAQKNIERAGFTGRLQTRLTDGLDGLEDCGLTDIIIAGMGGEVIAGILERAVFLQNPDLRLILQPQSRENVLRDFLAENGFAVQCEEAVLSGKFVYVVMTAQYTGQRRTLTEMERFCGLLPKNCTPEACEKMRRTASYLAECSKGFFARGETETANLYLHTSGEILSLILNYYL